MTRLMSYDYCLSYRLHQQLARLSYTQANVTTLITVKSRMFRSNRPTGCYWYWNYYWNDWFSSQL